MRVLSAALCLLHQIKAANYAYQTSQTTQLADRTAGKRAAASVIEVTLDNCPNSIDARPRSVVVASSFTATLAYFGETAVQSKTRSALDSTPRSQRHIESFVSFTSSNPTYILDQLPHDV